MTFVDSALTNDPISCYGKWVGGTVQRDSEVHAQEDVFRATHGMGLILAGITVCLPGDSPVQYGFLPI